LDINDLKQALLVPPPGEDVTRILEELLDGSYQHLEQYTHYAQQMDMGEDYPTATMGGEMVHDVVNEIASSVATSAATPVVGGGMTLGGSGTSTTIHAPTSNMPMQHATSTTTTSSSGGVDASMGHGPHAITTTTTTTTTTPTTKAGPDHGGHGPHGIVESQDQGMAHSAVLPHDHSMATQQQQQQQQP